MEIYTILMEKQKVLQHYGLPTAAQFTLEEIETLSDVNLLRAFKLTHKFPQDYEKSANILECVGKIIAGDNIYRVLEFCIFKNKVLRMPVYSIFPRLGDLNEL